MNKVVEPIGFSNGQFVAQSQMAVSVFDIGFIHGLTVAEQVRTIAGKPFLLDRHFQRWSRGLRLLGLACAYDLLQLEKILRELVEVNRQFLNDTTEQGICFFALPGSSSFGWTPNEKQPDSANSNPEQACAELYAYTYPLRTNEHQRNYKSGVALETTAIQDVAGQCWPKDVKIRSRLHYYLAQKQTRPGNYPILLDQLGNVSDSSIGSIAAWSKAEGLVVRPNGERYDSISLEYLCGLTERLGHRVTQRFFKVEELTQFEELFLVSTPWCIYPVSSVDGIRFAASARAFPRFQELIAAWEQSAGAKIQS